MIDDTNNLIICKKTKNKVVTMVTMNIIVK